MLRPIFISLLIGLFAIGTTSAQKSYQTSKPWTYWWWMGSAVDRDEISHELEGFAKSGLGGVHIIPIYGAKGYENDFIPFLSEKWLSEVQYTIERAKELNLGVDITLGTGWPFGGPWISEKYSAKQMVMEELLVENSNSLETEAIKALFKIDTLIAVYGRIDGISINILKELSDESVAFLPQLQGQKIDVFGIRPTRQKVKRAAPGGEGLVMDYFDKASVEEYLTYFDSIFENTKFPIEPRSVYHDSYEVYKADWTSDFNKAFNDQHGYALNDYLHVLTDTANVSYPHFLHDIRATIDELLYSKFGLMWTEWSKKKNKLTRYQAHGSPSNLLDLYALSDIPETESFGCSNFDIPGLVCDADYEEDNFGRPSPLMMKFASSPAHLLNKPLVSSETATWLANHFKVSLKRVKPQIDELFTAGINHVFYHGTTYSPEKEGFPGWLFYASTNFGNTSHFSEEFPLLNQYITNCQSLLQESKADNNILLYFPLSDIWTKTKGDILLMQDVHHYDKWFSSNSFGKTANQLWENGYSFDYISDKQIEALKIDDLDNIFISPASKYQVILIPNIDYIPKETLDKLTVLANKGVKVVFAEEYPENYSGLMAARSGSKPSLGGESMVSKDIIETLKEYEVPSEVFSENDLQFMRKKNRDGTLYFIANLGAKTFEETIRLSSDYSFVNIYNPLSNTTEYIETNDEFEFKILPGETYFIQTLKEKPETDKKEVFQAYDTLSLDKEWTVSFDKAEEYELQVQYDIDKLTSWTTWRDEHLTSFMGKAVYAYNFSFDQEEQTNIKKFILEFDEIRESAEIFINGKSYGTIWSFPAQIDLPSGILRDNNRLEIVVQNLSSNFMRVYDKENPDWKKFYDINFVDITYTPFDASKWEIEPSGLIGEVRLIKYR